LATKVDFSKLPLKVWIDEEKLIEADAVIVATGASAKWLGLDSEQRLNGFGVSACAVCDGFFFRGKEVAIVGAGDTAAEEALYLSKLCSTVHMFIRRDAMRASKVMQERVQQTPNIKVYWNTETDEILGENKVDSVRIRNIKTGGKTNHTGKWFFCSNWPST
jgi:thioredoxin reductase (NADPH)